MKSGGHLSELARYKVDSHSLTKRNVTTLRSSKKRSLTTLIHHALFHSLAQSNCITLTTNAPFISLSERLSAGRYLIHLRTKIPLRYFMSTTTTFIRLGISTTEPLVLTINGSATNYLTNAALPERHFLWMNLNPKRCNNAAR